MPAGPQRRSVASRARKSRRSWSKPMKWSMWACDTNTASTRSSVAAGVRSMRPRSMRSARPCQRSETRSAGSPVWPFSSRGRKLVFMRRSGRLHFLEDHAGRVGHHLLHDLAQGLPAVLELAGELREQREVALLGLEAHGGEPPVHGLHEALVRLDDLTVEILLDGGRCHGRSIGDAAAAIQRARRTAALATARAAGRRGACGTP